MQNVKVICDSPSDISVEEAKELGIKMLPTLYTFDGVNYLEDGISQTKEEFYEQMKTVTSLPKTSLITLERWKDAFLDGLKEFGSVVCFTMSSVGSGTYHAACMARDEILEENPSADLTVLDSFTYSLLYGAPVIDAAKVAQNGGSKDEVLKAFEDSIKGTQIYFMVDDLKYLKMGGRINAATLFAANLMDIKPILTIADGLVANVGKVRGGKKVFDNFFKFVDAKGHKCEGKDLILIHSCEDDRLQTAIDAINEKYKPNSIKPWMIGAVIGTHAGPGVVGIVFKEN